MRKVEHNCIIKLASACKFSYISKIKLIAHFVLIFFLIEDDQRLSTKVLFIDSSTNFLLCMSSFEKLLLFL